MKMKPGALRLLGLFIMGFLGGGGPASAADQVWFDAGANNLWNLADLNWDGGTAWTNGNSAVFSGGGGLGETVDTDAAISVLNITFQTNGYTVADADNNGSLTFAGAPSLVTVVNAGDTGTVSEVIAGSGGFTKAGNGVLYLTGTNTYSGTTTVSTGVLRLARGVLQGLGNTGTGNDTVVAAGATLDFNGCYVNSGTSERFTIAGAGVDGKGVLVNTGTDMVNRDIAGITLQDDAVVGGPYRMDFAVVTGNGKTLTKTGAQQLCVKNLTNATVIINQGQYTMLSDNRALGGTSPGDTIVNGGSLNAWNTMSVPERITFNGGSISQGNPSLQLLTLTGYLTVNSNVTFNTGSITSGVEIAGYVDGNGGFTQGGGGWCFFTCNTNAYTGPTVINGGCPLYVGKTNLYSGVLGLGTVTNNGSLYGYSSRISQGNIVNGGSIYCMTGQLCSGSVLNNGSLYFDRGGSYVISNAFSGGGTVFLRFKPSVAISGSASTNTGLRIGAGSLTLTNGALFRFTGEIQVADRFAYSLPDPTNVTGIINVSDGCALYAQAITFGNGTNVVNGGMTGVLNQAGGSVYTTGKDGGGEGNGIRLGHYPQAYAVYNMMGGTLTVGADADLGCATDGQGWFNMTGGEVFTTRVMLNERTGSGGSGRLTVSGGVLNVGTLNTLIAPVTNAITVDAGGPYLVEYGGAGGTIRAVTNLFITLDATLYGSNATAITFDSRDVTISLSGRLTGAGGFNKAGAGVLTLSNTNTFSGPTCVNAGTLRLGVANALTNTSVTVAAGALFDLGGAGQKVAGLGGSGTVSNGSPTVTGAVTPGTDGSGTLTLAAASAAPGGTLVANVTSNGTCGVLHVAGSLSLAGMSLQVANPSQLNEHSHYTVAECEGTLSGIFSAVSLPQPWYVFYDWESGAVQLRAARGTMLRLK